MDTNNSNAQLILYSYFRSSCSWRVRIALNLLDIPYDIIPINLLKSEQTHDSYKSLNPNATLPSLIIPPSHSLNPSTTQITLNQSIAILEFLHEQSPNKSILLPSDPIQRAQIRALVGMIASDIQPIQNLRVLTYVGAEKKMEWGKYWITLGLQNVEKYLAGTAGRFCVGDSVSMADICLIPQVYNANRFGVDMSAFPLISAIAKTCEEIDAFKRARPEVQIDCPEDLRAK